MTIRGSSKIFKFALISFFALIFMLAVSRQTISQTNGNIPKRSFLGPFKERFETSKKNDEEEIISVAKEFATSNVEYVEELVTTINVDTVKPEPLFEKNDKLESDRIPGAYLKSSFPAPTNRTYCKFNYKLPHGLDYTNEDLTYPPQRGKESQYRILYNATEAYWVRNVPQVTYCTHITANFAYFIPELLKRWDGLVTIAAYVPDKDIAFFIEQINQYCYCEPEMFRVSIHLITHRLLPFSKEHVSFDRPANCRPIDSSKIPTYKNYHDNLIYPINVIRNTARMSALTKYVLLSDIELMPSNNMARNFLKFIATHKKTNPKEVFVLPIFEVERNVTVPGNKGKLLQLLSQQMSVYFHGLICAHCQKFPGIKQWMMTGYSPEIKALLAVKRHKPYHRWEPIFIGTNEEPLYHERLSWEGLQDKMTQSLEMCLQNYTYVILDNAFLCHWPGIKRKKVAQEKWRKPFVEENKKAYNQTITDLAKHYQNIEECELVYELDVDKFK